MAIICPACNKKVFNESKQARNQVYCTPTCRKRQHRIKKRAQNLSVRIQHREDNLLLNDEMRYVVAQCKYAGTVQILSDHTLESLARTMELIRNRPAGHVHLCHVAPVKGNQFIGLLHYRNLYYGGDYQNNIFRNSHAGGGLYIALEDLAPVWTVGADIPNKEVLRLIKKFLGDVLTDYIKSCSVRKSKRVQIARKIMESDNQLTMDELLDLSFNELSDLYKTATRKPLYKPAKHDESKFLAYMDSLTRFIELDIERRAMLKKLRELMVMAYMALERIEASDTFNREFYVKYEPLVKIKYGQVMLKNENNWSPFKDLVYEAAFMGLQGCDINIRKLRKKIMSYLHFPEKAWRVTASPWQYRMMYTRSLD